MYDFVMTAKLMVVDQHNKSVKRNGPFPITSDEVSVIWAYKTLHNWKVFVGTNDPEDNKYYEVTHDGEKMETYIDVYKKLENVCIPD